MLRRIVGWVVLVPLCLVLIVFALANRQLVVVNFNPLVPSEALTTPGVGVPLFLVMFAVLLFGVLLGGIATAGPGAFLAELDRMADELHAHLDYEEESLIPVLAGIPFPPAGPGRP